MTLHLGLDLGGTNIKWVLLEHAGSEPRVVERGTAETHAERGPQAVVERLAAVGDEAIAGRGRPATLGVGLAGLYDAASGRAEFLPNLPGEWDGVPVAGPIGEALGVRVSLINDARAFTLAETRLGAGRGHRNVVCFVLGTGVGGGVMIDGRLYQGHKGSAGELGHQTIDPFGPRCGCGNFGCVEAYVGAPHLADAGGRPTPAEVFTAAAEGDLRAGMAVHRAATALGIGIANAIVAFTPDRVVVGGGVAAAGEALLGPVRAEVRRRVFITENDRIDIVNGALEEYAGAIGAALWGLESAA